MNLGTVAAIRSGLVLSRKLSPEISSYRYPLLNLRAIHPDGYVRPDSLEVFYATEPLRQEYLTQQDDIIIRLSIPYTAILIDANMAGMVVSSNFAIIRLNQDYILPEYLLWRLNTADIFLSHQPIFLIAAFPASQADSTSQLFLGLQE